MNYTDLTTGTVKDWLARNDISATKVAGFVDLAESRLNRSLRIRAMEKVYNELLDAAGTTPCGSDVLEFKHIFLVDVEDDGILTLDDDFSVDSSDLLVQSLPDTSKVYPLEWRSVADMASEYEAGRSSGDTPKYVTRYGDRLYFWPASTGETYTAIGIHYEKFAELTDAEPDNWLTENAPDVILAATMVEACAWIQSPEKLQYWQSRLDRALNELQGQDDRQEFSGTPLRQRLARCGP